jgi:PST family polysaccharide transporter
MTGVLGVLLDRARKLIRHNVVKNALFLYGVQLSSYIFPLVAVPYLSRVLGPAKFGLIAFAQSFIWYFVTLTEYGFNLTATRRIAVHADDPEVVSETFNSVMAAKLLLCTAGFVIMTGTVLAVPKFRGNWLLYVLSYLAVIGNALFPQWLFQGLQKLQHVAWRDFAAKLLSLIAIFVFVHKESDYLLAAAIQAGAFALSGVAGLLTVPMVTFVRFSIPPWHAVRARLKEGFAVFLSMAAMNLYSSTNMFILGLVSYTEAGYFSGAQRVIVALRMLASPLVTALYPHISHMANRSQQDAIRFVRKYSLILSAPFFLGGLALLVGAPIFIPLFLGPKFQPSIVLFQIMAFSPCLCSLAHTYTTYYMLAFGYDKEWSKIILSGTALNFIVLPILLWLIRPSEAVAIMTTILDLYVVVTAYWFYVKTSPRHMQVATALP